MVSVASAMLTLLRDATTQTVSPIDIGDRLELFVDDYLIDEIVWCNATVTPATTAGRCLCA